MLLDLQIIREESKLTVQIMHQDPRVRASAFHSSLILYTEGNLSVRSAARPGFQGYEGKLYLHGWDETNINTVSYTYPTPQDAFLYEEFLHRAVRAINTGEIVNPEGAFGELYRRSIYIASGGDLTSIRNYADGIRASDLGGSRSWSVEDEFQLRRDIPSIYNPIYVQYVDEHSTTTIQLADTDSEIVRRICNRIPVPITQGMHIGIEIELMLPIPKAKEVAKQLLKEVPYLTEKLVSIGQDGSIKPPRDSGLYGYEIRLLIPVGKLTSIVTDVCTALGKLGAKVNKSCGLHVHLDQRQSTPISVYKTYRKLTSALPLLFRCVPPTRRENKFCRDEKLDEHTAFKSMYDREEYDEDADDSRAYRYRAISLSSYTKYETIEVRLHSGTTSADKILSWVNLLLAITKRRKRKSRQQYMAYLSSLKLSSAQVEYWKARIAKFDISTEELESRYSEEDAA